MNTRTVIVGSASLSLAATILSVAATATPGGATTIASASTIKSTPSRRTDPPIPAGRPVVASHRGGTTRPGAEGGGNGVAPAAFAFPPRGAAVGAGIRRGQRRRRSFDGGSQSSPVAVATDFGGGNGDGTIRDGVGGDVVFGPHRRRFPHPRDRHDRGGGGGRVAATTTLSSDETGGGGGNRKVDYSVAGSVEAAVATRGDGLLAAAATAAAPLPAAERGVDHDREQNNRRGGGTRASGGWQHRRTGGRRRRLSTTPCHGDGAAVVRRPSGGRFWERDFGPNTVAPAMAASALHMATRGDGNGGGNDQETKKDEGGETSDAASRGGGGLGGNREDSTNDRAYSFPDDEGQSLSVDDEDEDGEAFFGDDVDDLYSFDEDEDYYQDFHAYDDATLLGLLEGDDGGDIIGPDAFDLLEMERAMDSIGFWNDDDGDGGGGIDRESEESNPDDSSPVTGSPVPVDAPSAIAAGGGNNPLERALLEGVVPADAGVGSGSLPGDYGFDPLNLASTDYIQMVQSFLLRFIPPSPYQRALGRRTEMEEKSDDAVRGEPSAAENTAPEPRPPRPPALVLRDYREAEIRHGRLAMLAAVLWPVQELIDRFFLPVDEYKTTIVYGGPTLPYLSLLMTLIMMLLGYLDIYASAVKEGEAGDAFLPGECFWDPLKMLDGAPDAMKKRMQERELNNGRMSMIAVAAYFLQEAIFHRPVVSLEWNQILFEPAFEIPAVQHWLDERFQSPSPTFYYPAADKGQVDFVEIVKETLKEDGL